MTGKVVAAVSWYQEGVSEKVYPGSNTNCLDLRIVIAETDGCYMPKAMIDLL